MRILLVTTLLLFAGAASAGLYKWVDEDGNVHYSQKPPRDVQFKRLKAPPPPPDNAKPLYGQPNNKSNAKTSSAGAAETVKNKKIREENCAIAKKNLNAYQVYRRFKEKDGSVRTVSDAERSAQIEKAKQAIEDFCN